MRLSWIIRAFIFKCNHKCPYEREAGVTRVRERFEDPTLLVWKLDEGIMSQ